MMGAVSAPFIPGLALSERFYAEAVAPLLDRHFRALPYAAARIGSGSEVLGYDTPRSTDHEWGPRLQLFLTGEDVVRHGPAITQVLSDELPKTFLGYPTNFVTAGEDGDIRQMRLTDGPVQHRIEVTDAQAWFASHLGFDPSQPVTTADWLAIPWQRLLEFTAGAVFRDDLGMISAGRRRLEWYPTDVERYVLACQWRRIAQQEAFPGRCAEVGDDLGSANVAGRLVRDIMQLWLLLHRKYPPYSKWLGTAFARLPGTADLAAHLRGAQLASDWSAREDHLIAAYESTAVLQNRFLDAGVDPTVSSYFDRPFRVIHAQRFVDALLESISDGSMRSRTPMGSVDQWIDNTDALDQIGELRAISPGRTRYPPGPA
jgi:uncharacterized protein DUF4037